MKHWLVREVADRLRCKAEKIRQLIECGELEAINTATPGSKRPRFLITEKAVADFEERRAVQSRKRAESTLRRKRKPSAVGPTSY